MSEIPKAYEPQAVESKWYQYWTEHKCFVADPASAKPPYSIVIPPPNVTGILTLGHVLNNTIQDILARLARMKGFEVLWLPGTDHAGIATQAVVERALKQEGVMKHRDDLGREKFLEKTWQWKEKHGGIIIDQLKKLGASCDWSRERFTMDPEYARCVSLIFVELYKKGLIYRGKRMVNWDPAARTALSDEEVEMTERRGSLWHLKYPMLDDQGQPSAEEFVIVATTRPETMLGDEAVAVNPTDPRYQHLIGRRALLPLRNKAIPIIADQFVDAKFGTGCVKVTPAHDPNDYEMALRHNLPLTVVIGPNGAMTPEAGADFAGLDRAEARKKVVEKLTEAGLLLKTEDYTHNVGHSQRSGVAIEPYLSEQWFLRYPCVKESTAAVENGQIQFHPERWSKTYLHWMRDIRDWCISRQLWWGHRIPVWYRKTPDASGDPAANIFVSVDPPVDAENWEQDPDVLDTWFSSWLWPFATMGWPGKTPTLERFYPTTDLVTGPDIIFFWVARMIMAGYEFMGDRPFKNVYFTGIVRDKQGRKMSKSLGNSPDPLKLIEQYGADALRFGIMRSAPLGQDVLYDEQQVELGRNFCNKLWNACRFRQMQAGDVEGEISPALLTSDDKWLLLKLDRAIREITESLEQYKFNEAAQTLYRFFWSELCDWYLEAGKAALGGSSGNSDAAVRANTLAVIDFVLSNTLRLFHPFLPFITEELWHGLGFHSDLPAGQGGDTIMLAHWPKPFDEDFLKHYGLRESDLQYVEQRNWLITQGRNLRQSGNIQSSKKVNFVLKPAAEISSHDLAAMKLLLNAAQLDVKPDYAPPKGTPSVSGEPGELFLPLEGLVDAGAEKARLTKELEKTAAEIEKVEKKLGNPAFTQKAPPAVLDEHRQRLADWKAKHSQIKNSLDALAG
jgi:valyl-tRNA synthetase